MKNIYLKIGIVGGITGCISVALGNAFIANIIWFFFNPMMIIHNVKVREGGQAILWSIYAIIALGGIIKHLLEN